MTGMGGSLSASEPGIVQAFQRVLLHQALVVLGVVALLAVAWNLLRAALLRRSDQHKRSNAPPPEPVAHLALRVAFGLLWVFDGILQAQSSMPIGLADRVIEPAAASSPAWVRHLVGSVATIWNDHPIVAASSVVWIQVGLGLFLLVAPRRRWSQLAGITSAAWGLVVWVFGEALGGVLGHGATLLFGAPGAALFYAFAGVLVALPEEVWARRSFRFWLLRGLGVFFLGMAALQAWPGRGFWNGRSPDGGTGTLASMIAAMARTPQPPPLRDAASAFGSFDAAHGFAVNLVAVLALTAIGAALASARPALVRVGFAVLAPFALATWILVQDLGFLGGLGTDPNSMLPLIAVTGAACLALLRAPAAVSRPEPMPWRMRVRQSPSYALRSMAALGAMGIMLLGAAPMALASSNPHADPILIEALNGAPTMEHSPAPPFSLTDQQGRHVSLASMRGHTVVLTFLDPASTSDGPFIAQALAESDRALGSARRQVQLVAVVANPAYRSRAMVSAFDRTEGLVDLHNWSFLTGSVTQLRSVWRAYGIEVGASPAATEATHRDLAYVIDARGRTRVVFGTNPGTGTEATRSSLAGLVTNEVQMVLSS